MTTCWHTGHASPGTRWRARSCAAWRLARRRAPQRRARLRPPPRRRCRRLAVRSATSTCSARSTRHVVVAARDAQVRLPRRPEVGEGRVAPPAAARPRLAPAAVALRRPRRRASSRRASPRRGRLGHGRRHHAPRPMRRRGQRAGGRAAPPPAALQRRPRRRSSSPRGGDARGPASTRGQALVGRRQRVVVGRWAVRQARSASATSLCASSARRRSACVIRVVDAELEQLTSRSWRSAGLSCRKRANSPWGSTTQRVKCSNGRPSSASTAAVISLRRPASTVAVGSFEPGLLGGGPTVLPAAHDPGRDVPPAAELEGEARPRASFGP